MHAGSEPQRQVSSRAERVRGVCVDVVKRDQIQGRGWLDIERVRVRDSDRSISAEPVAGGELRRAVSGHEQRECDERACNRRDERDCGRACAHAGGGLERAMLCSAHRWRGNNMGIVKLCCDEGRCRCGVRSWTGDDKRDVDEGSREPIAGRELRRAVGGRQQCERDEHADHRGVECHNASRRHLCRRCEPPVQCF